VSANQTKKTETAVNFVKPKSQFFAKETKNLTKVIFCQPHTPTFDAI